MPQQVEELSIVASISVPGVVVLVERQWGARIVLIIIIRITEKAPGNPAPVEAIVPGHTNHILAHPHGRRTMAPANPPSIRMIMI